MTMTFDVEHVEHVGSAEQLNLLVTVEVGDDELEPNGDGNTSTLTLNLKKPLMTMNLNLNDDF